MNVRVPIDDLLKEDTIKYYEKLENVYKVLSKRGTIMCTWQWQKNIVNATNHILTEK